MLDELKAYDYSNTGFFYPERIIPLHCMLIGCGYEMQTNHEYVWNGLKRGPKEMVIWQYTLSGRGGLRVGSEDFPLLPGQALLVKVPEDHCYYLPPDSPSWEFIHATFNGREAIRLLDNLRAKTGPVCRFDSGSATIRCFLEMFHLANKKRISTPWQNSRLAYELVMAMSEDQLGREGNLFQHPDFITQAINFCIGNMHRQIGVADMAEQSGLSRFHFSREFKKHTGIAPAAYLQELRLKKAIRMLQSERKTIKEIAYACGYDDCSYFCRIFHRAYGIAPGNYRETTVLAHPRH